MGPDDFDRDRIDAARRMPPSRKLALGAELFEVAQAVVVGGLRADRPGLTDDELVAEFKRRLRLAARQDESD